MGIRKIIKKGDISLIKKSRPVTEYNARLKILLDDMRDTLAEANGVGLAAPHLVRSMIATRHAALLVLSALMGGALLLAADIGARWLLAPQELPVGVLTALLGGMYLLRLMHRRGNAL